MTWKLFGTKLLMVWGQSDQSREAAREILQTVIALEKELTRLQEQQVNDNERYFASREEMRQLQRLLREVESKVSDYGELLGRVQFLEAALTTFGADLQKDYLSRDEFLAYKENLSLQAEKLKMEVAIAEANKIKTTRRQWGLMGAGFIGGFVAIAPKLWEFLLWLFEQIKALE